MQSSKKSLGLANVVVALGLIGSLILLGCGQSQSAPGKSRSSGKKPTFKKDLDQLVEVDKESVPSSDIVLPFVHPDHFAIFSVDVNQVTSSNTLKEVNWDDLQSFVQTSYGINSLDEMERIWFLLDGEFFTFLPSEDSRNPLLTVIELKSDVDSQVLGKRLTASRKQTFPGAPQFEMGVPFQISDDYSVLQMNSRRIVSGAPEAVAKLDSETNQLLVDRFYQLEPKYGTGLVDVKAIRPQIKTIFDLVASFIGNEFAAIPDAIDLATLQFDLDSRDFTELNVRIKDKGLAQSIAGLMQSSGGSSGPSMGMSEMMGIGTLGNLPKQMHSASAMGEFQNLVQEVMEKQLMAIRLNGEELQIKLDRPESLDQMVNAILTDQRKRVELDLRISQATKIAAALKTYSQKFGHLPPSGPVSPAESSEFARAQFNWQTGLLPELGYQDLYDKFDFSEPFDSEANQKLLREMPSELGEQKVADEGTGEKSDKNGMTRFKALGGIGVWGDGKGQPKVDDIKDSKVTTALIGESYSNGIWTDPKSGLWKIDEVQELDIGDEEENGWIVITARFEVRIVVREQDALSAIITPDGDEILTRDRFIQTKRPENP